MRKLFFTFLLLFCALLHAVPADDGWLRKGEFCRLKGDLAAVEVPSGAEMEQNWLERELDLVPFRGKDCLLHISEPTRP